MAQGITVQGKTAGDRSQPVLVDNDGQVYVLLEGVSTSSKQDEIVAAIEALTAAPTYDIRNISPPTDPEIATYKYFGFQERGGTNWRVMRKTLATNAFLYATGTTSYSTNWTNRASLTYT